jgi:hypothetical protein
MLEDVPDETTVSITGMTERLTMVITDGEILIDESGFVDGYLSEQLEATLDEAKGKGKKALKKAYKELLEAGYTPQDFYNISDTIGRQAESVAEELQKKKIWGIRYDGWFEYYVCNNCGYKLQLTTAKKPLPKICPQCQNLEDGDNYE